LAKTISSQKGLACECTRGGEDVVCEVRCRM